MQPKDYPPCTVLGCVRMATYGELGYCNMHKTRWMRHGSPDIVRPFPPVKRMPATCTEADCEKRHFARGLCQTHYNKLRLIVENARRREVRANARAESKERKNRVCSIQGCGRDSRVGDLCMHHYHKAPDADDFEPRTKTLSPEVQRIVYRQWADAHSGRSGLTVADIAAQWGISAALVNRVVLAVQTCFVIRPMEVRA